MKRKKTLLLVIFVLLSLVLFPSCKSQSTTPDMGKDIWVDILYVRQDDIQRTNLHQGVHLNCELSLPNNNEMEEIEKDQFIIENIRVRTLRVSYRTFARDMVYAQPDSSQEEYDRAHKLYTRLHGTNDWYPVVGWHKEKNGEECSIVYNNDGSTSSS